MTDRLGDLPDGPTDPVEAIDHRWPRATDGLMGMPSGRFFGWVIGARTRPRSRRTGSPARGTRTGDAPLDAGRRRGGGRAGAWALDLLGLPAGADVGFVTGATMANFTGLAPARRRCSPTRAGTSAVTASRVVRGSGCSSGPSGTRPSTSRCATSGSGRRQPSPPTTRAGSSPTLGRALADGRGPTIVCLQAGNLHSGAFDPIAEAIALAHEHGAWVHVDGAFGLWAAASPRLRHLVAGHERADSWATDAHKTLNVPYDCGLAIVAHPEPLRAALGMHGEYFATSGPGDPLEKVPELSRRARGVPVWAALRSLGRCGVRTWWTDVANARAIADGIGRDRRRRDPQRRGVHPGLRGFGDDERPGR